MSALERAVNSIRDDNAKQEAKVIKVRDAVVLAVLNEASNQATPDDATIMRQAIELEIYSVDELRALVDVATTLRVGSEALQDVQGARREAAEAEKHFTMIRDQHVERLNLAGQHFREARANCSQLEHNALQIAVIKKSHPELHAEWLRRQDGLPTGLGDIEEDLPAALGDLEDEPHGAIE